MGIHFDLITVIHQASITDWIQAIAALLAVVGTIATLWKLYQRDEQKQAMIVELQQQTKHFGAQVEQLGAQVFQLKNIHEAIAKGIEYMAKDDGLKAELKKLEIRPDFNFESHVYKAGWVVATLKALNRGGLARNVRLTKPEGIPLSTDRHEEVRPGDSMTITMRAREKMEPATYYDLHFEDALGNAYTQRFDMRHGMPTTGPVRPVPFNDETQEP